MNRNSLDTPRYITSTAILTPEIGTQVNPGSIDTIRYDGHYVMNNSFSSVQLRTFSMPVPSNIVDWSAFNSLKNNVFAFNYGSVDYTFNIPEGSYDGCNLATTIQTFMNTTSGATGNFTVTYSPITCKFEISSASGTFTLDFTSNYSPWWEMGFAQATYGATGDQISPYMVNLEWSPMFLIYIPEMAGSLINGYNRYPATFAIPVTMAGTYLQGWSYKTSGPSHIQDLGVEKYLSQWTLSISFIRAGVVYPLVADKQSSYCIDLAFMERVRA